MPSSRVLQSGYAVQPGPAFDVRGTHQHKKMIVLHFDFYREDRARTHTRTHTHQDQVGLYKAHNGIKWLSSEELEPRIPQMADEARHQSTICCMGVSERLYEIVAARDVGCTKWWLRDMIQYERHSCVVHQTRRESLSNHKILAIRLLISCCLSRKNLGQYSENTDPKLGELDRKCSLVHKFQEAQASVSLVLLRNKRARWAFSQEPF